MKKILLLSCIILCAIHGYGQSSDSTLANWPRELIYEDDTVTRRAVIVTKLPPPEDGYLHYDSGKIWVGKGDTIRGDLSKNGYWHTGHMLYVDTGYSITHDTIYIQDTIRKPNNIVGIYGDGSMHIFTAKMLIHRYRQIRWSMGFVTENYHNTWGHQWEIVGGLKSVLDNVVGIYSYELTGGIYRTVSYSYSDVYFTQDKLRNLKIGPKPNRIPRRTRVRRNGR